MGLHKYFREKGSKAKFIVADPIGSIYESYFCKRCYKPSSWSIEGIGSNFIPGIINNDIVDDVYCVSDERAFDTCKMIRESDALDVGLSSGATIATAIQLIETNTGGNIVCLSPDAGERYISKLQAFGG